MDRRKFLGNLFMAAVAQALSQTILPEIAKAAPRPDLPGIGDQFFTVRLSKDYFTWGDMISFDRAGMFLLKEREDGSAYLQSVSDDADRRLECINIEWIEKDDPVIQIRETKDPLKFMSGHRDADGWFWEAPLQKDAEFIVDLVTDEPPQIVSRLFSALSL